MLNLAIYCIHFKAINVQYIAKRIITYLSNQKRRLLIEDQFLLINNFATKYQPTSFSIRNDEVKTLLVLEDPYLWNIQIVYGNENMFK